MPTIDHVRARALLEASLRKAEAMLIAGGNTDSSSHLERLSGAIDAVFSSDTQAYREVLLGCLLVRILDKRLDVTLPYASQGENAYNGRDVDERVVNPFLKTNHIPSSKGPFLSVFRRQVRFDEATREGVRDKAGYDAFIKIVSEISRTVDDSYLSDLLIQVLLEFARLRENSSIELANVSRLSLRQVQFIADRLLLTASGGLSPVLLVVAMLETIKSTYGLDWNIAYQGINVSDRSTGAGGDVMVSSGGGALFTMEITERPVDIPRLTATFRTKIAPQGIKDYLFVIHKHSTEAETVSQAARYFSQGHDVNIIDIRQWLEASLATVGVKGRDVYKTILLRELAKAETPVVLKAAWNSAIESLVG